MDFALFFLGAVVGAVVGASIGFVIAGLLSNKRG